MAEFIYISLWLGLSYVYGGLCEWAFHKYALHGLGKRKNTIFSFHWHSHHKGCRKNNNFDIDYKLPFAPPVKKEVFSLLLLLWTHFIFLFIQPYFFIGLVFYTSRYFYMHRRSHIDVEWGKKNIPWHHDHHMGANQDANYGVTVEWPDKLFGTRIVYGGNKKHERK